MIYSYNKNMRSGIITIIIFAWIIALAWGLRSFISKSIGGTPNPKSSTTETSATTPDIMDEQRIKMDQVRKDQKRVMEELKQRSEDSKR